MGRRQSRAGWIGSALLVALAASIVVGGAVSAGAAAGSGAHARESLGMLLRLHDLPPGYLMYAGPREGEDAAEPLCAGLTKPEGTPPDLAKVVERFHPKGCFAVYARIYTVPGPAPSGAMVATGAMPLPSKAAADAVWKVVPTMLGSLAATRPHPVPTEIRIGERTELLHARVPPFPLNYFGKRASYLVWQTDGNALATVLAVADDYATSDQVVAELAPRQQAHTEMPTPYTQAERYDGEVGLDDPRIRFPVHWLGREFDPGGELPSNQLSESYYRGKPRPEKGPRLGEGPRAPLRIGYENIRLETWTPATWPVFARSKTGRAVTSWRCTETRTVAVLGGTATIFGGYDQDFAKCPRRRPRAFTAWVRYPDETVVVNPPFAADSIELVNPYGSFAAMEALVRALQVRPPTAVGTG